MNYDPLCDPDPQEWLALSESERIDEVAEYHLETDEDFPNLQLHAALQAAVESRIAVGDEIPVRATLRRLMEEGLDRHEAVHAIASVLAAHMYDLMTNRSSDEDPNVPYYRELEEFSVEAWMAQFDEMEE